MTLPERYDITIDQGASFKRWFRLRYTDGSIVDLADAGDGYIIGRLQAKDMYDGTTLFTLTTDNYGISLTYEADADGNYWSGYISMSADSTADLDAWGDGVYDFEISDGTDVIRVFQGSITLSPESTTDE